MRTSEKIAIEVRRRRLHVHQVHQLALLVEGLQCDQLPHATVSAMAPKLLQWKAMLERGGAHGPRMAMLQGLLK